MELNFENHTRSNQSCLETWRKEITAMRQKAWPYKRIAQWLWEKKGITISSEAIRQFCCVRGIIKNVGSKNSEKSSAHNASHRPSSKASVLKKVTVDRVFEYDDSKPIEIDR